MADTQIQVITSDFVEITITNSQNEAASVQRRFFKSISIGEFKSRLELLTGGRAATMRLQLFSKDDTLVGVLDKDELPLGSYPIDSGMRVHVIDDFKYEDHTAEKFKLTEEQYDQRSDTLKNFLKTNRLGKYNEEAVKERKMQRAKERKEELDKAQTMEIGDRCQVRIPGLAQRKGQVAYKGPVEGQHGVFIGIRYDEPVGKNDGTLAGKRYFDCNEKYGGFVKPRYVEVGDFPEDELVLSDSEEI
ncbi:tubulin-folding cofactor B-like [Ctenocephalides felis]|uniref:tubulin-folding cofactor B-like n=1 Tax=Ctenocephalides felis TaxID=7515 RepID=UPI000E6E4C4D|nr:tubulin-folding cofactor B-like [Ctenocephalides felis]XP_026469387.1 tubulin-folding cofactor B-like [Ctenocephalides felis]